MFARLPSGRRVFFDVSGEKLTAMGSELVDRPTVLLVHGSEVDHTFFKPWLAPLSGEAQLVYVDLLGHGRSDPGEADDWTHEGWAASLVAFCAAIGIEHTVVLGSSMGGRVALHLALGAPSLVDALVLVHTVGRPRPDRRVEMFRLLGGDEAADAAERDIHSPTDETRDAYFRLCMPHLVQTPYSPDELARLTPPAPGVFERLVELGRSATDLLPQVSAISCPTLVITGEFDPAATPDDARDLAAAIGGNAEARIVARAGHGAYRDNPEEFLNVVGPWIADLAPHRD